MASGLLLCLRQYNADNYLLIVRHTSQCTDVQLTCLIAEALHLHLSSRHLVTSGTKAVMAKLLHNALQHKTALSPILWRISNYNLNYDRHFRNCYFYFHCLYLNNPVSKVARKCTTCTPSSVLLSSLMAHFLQHATSTVNTDLMIQLMNHLSLCHLHFRWSILLW